MNKWWVLASMCLLTMMLNLDATAVNLAIPGIAHQFHSTLTTAQWIINAFILFSAMLQILGGHLGDKFERRQMFLIGTVIFIIGSTLCGFATNITAMIIGRIMQGIALGLAYPVSIVITNDVFPKDEHGKAMGIIMGVMGLSLALGPTIGGLIVQFANWRWIFFINIPLGLLTVYLTLRLVPKTYADHAPDMDLPGNLTLILALFLLVLSLNQSQTWGFSSPLFLGCLAFSFIFFGALFVIETRSEHPVIDFSLFSLRNFNLNCVARWVGQTVFIPVLFFVPLFLVNIAEFSPLHAGLSLLALTLVIGLLSPVVGHWVDCWGHKPLTILSCVLFVTGSVMMMMLHSKPSYVFLLSGLVLLGIATAINFVSTTVGALSVVPAKLTGVGTGMLMTLVWISCSLAISICGAIVGMCSEAHLIQRLAKLKLLLPQEAYASLLRAAHGLSPFKEITHNLPHQDLALLHRLTTQAFMHGFKSMLLFIAAFSIFGFVLSLLMDSTRTGEEKPVLYH